MLTARIQVHASTSSQPILDGYSKKNRRLGGFLTSGLNPSWLTEFLPGRGVGSNIIPTTTGAATAVQLVLPELAGKFTGTHSPLNRQLNSFKS